jgi:site-specific DNA-methyltransferase (adenine-specific)
MPLRRHEDILVFCAGRTTYNPQMVKGILRAKGTGNTNSPVYGEHKLIQSFNDDYYPTSIVEFYNGQQSEKLHPTQKSLGLFEYLIRTFSNSNETVLDPFVGSGTTAVAAFNTGRNFICFEKDANYYQIANKRLALAQMQGRFEEMVG